MTTQMTRNGRTSWPAAVLDGRDHDHVPSDRTIFLSSLRSHSSFPGAETLRLNMYFHRFSPHVDSWSFPSPCLNPTDRASFTLSDRLLPLAHPSRGYSHFPLDYITYSCFQPASSTGTLTYSQ